MKRLKRSARRSRTCKSKPRATAGASNKGKDASRVGKVPNFLFLPNAQDQIAIDKLRSVSSGGLAVDLFVRNDPQTVPLLRDALVEVYFKAAEVREVRRATKRQLNNARSALSRLKHAIKHLESVSTDGRGGLRMLLEGSLLDDKKGEREINQMASACWSIRLNVTRSSLALQSAIVAETKKPNTGGERRKRLRTLVDALAAWWLAGGGKSLAPYVRANRRDGDRAIVHGRSGKFLGLAIALRCGCF
jgi:hypothetical protein